MMNTAKYKIATGNVGTDFVEVRLSFPLQALLKTLRTYIEALRVYEQKHKSLLAQYKNLDDIPPEQHNELEELSRLKVDMTKHEQHFMAQKNPLRDLLYKEFTFLALKEEVLQALASSSQENALFKELFSSKDMLLDPLPLNMEVFFQNIGMAEIVKNALDAVIAKHTATQTEKEKTTLPDEVELQIRLSVQGPSISLCITDNAGGFPERYINDTTVELSQTDRKKRLFWLTNVHDSEKKADVKPYYFGGHGLGMKLIYGWMLEGINVEGRLKHRQLYDFNKRPDTSVRLSNVMHSDGKKGACITLVSPIVPISSIVDTEVRHINPELEECNLSKSPFWSTSQTPSPFSNTTIQSPEMVFDVTLQSPGASTKRTNSRVNFQSGSSADESVRDELEQSTDNSEISPFSLVLPIKNRVPQPIGPKPIKTFFASEENMTYNTNVDTEKNGNHAEKS